VTGLWFGLGFVAGALVTALVALWLSDPDDGGELDWDRDGWGDDSEGD
jgi:hypothetical protein